MALLQDRGGGERVCLLLSPWELSLGSWAERPLGLRQPRHKFLAYGDREGRKGGKVRAAEYSALQLGSAAPLCRAGCRVIRAALARGSGGLGGPGSTRCPTWDKCLPSSKWRHDGLKTLHPHPS